MFTDRRARLFTEVVLAAISAGILLVTFVWREWIELLFRVRPDEGSGSLEWAVVFSLFMATLTFSAMAGAEWRKQIAVSNEPSSGTKNKAT